MDSKRLIEGMLIGVGAGALIAYFIDREFGHIRRDAFANGARRVLAKAVQEGKKSFERGALPDEQIRIASEEEEELLKTATT